MSYSIISYFFKVNGFYNYNDSIVKRWPYLYRVVWAEDHIEY